MGTIAEKLNYSLETKELIKDGINYLGGNVTDETTLKEYREELDSVYNKLPKVSNSTASSNVTLNPTLKGRIDSTLKGQIGQEGNPSPENEIPVKSVTGENTVRVRGKNELSLEGFTNINKNGITIIRNNDDSITINGTAEVAFGETLIENINHFLRGNYIFSLHLISGSINANSFRISINNQESASAPDENARLFSFPVLRTTTNFPVYNLNNVDDTMYYLSIFINKSTEFNNFTFKLMVEKASENQTEPSDYEPYYEPQEKELDLEGENIFDRNNSTESKYLSAYTGSLSDSSVSDTSDYIPIDSKGLYLNYDFTTLLASNNRNLCYYDENKSFISGIIYNIQDKKIKVDYVQNAKYIRFTYDKNLTDIKVYKEKYELYEDGYFSLENGKWYLNNEYDKFIINSTFTQGNPANRFILQDNNLNKYSSSSIGLCTIGSVVGSAIEQPTENGLVNFYIQPSINLLNAYVKYNSMTLAQFNTKIQELISASKTLYLVAKLQTPSKTEITDTTLINQLNDIYKLMSYDGTTIIETECENGNMPIIISARALLDSAKVIEDLETRIEVLESEE